MRAFLIALLAVAGMGSASAADLKLLTAGAFKSVAQELVADFEKKTGHKVTIENDTAGAVARRVRDGEYVDVVVIPPGAMGPLLGSRLVESSAKPLARVGTYLANLFEKMGIAAELKPKTVLVKGGLAGEKLLTGEADIAMQPASELLAVPGTVLVGPIPLEVQTYILYSGAVSTGARNQTDADALLRALWGPGKEDILKKKGMELP